MLTSRRDTCWWRVKGSYGEATVVGGGEVCLIPKGAAGASAAVDVSGAGSRGAEQRTRGLGLESNDTRAQKWQQSTL